MFEQTPHPFYIDILTQSYSLKSPQNSDSMKTWFQWCTPHQKLLVKMRNGSLQILDPKDSKRSTFPYVNFEIENNKEEIEKFLSSYVYSIKKSLKTENIKAMKLILNEINRTYPDIKQVSFNIHTKLGRNYLRFYDQDYNNYKINGKNIFNFISNFYFINNMSLNDQVFIEKTTQHQLIENFEESENIKKLLKINPIISKTTRSF